MGFLVGFRVGLGFVGFVASVEGSITMYTNKISSAMHLLSMKFTM